MSTPVRNKVLLRAEQSHGTVSIIETTMPARAPGPPLHSHAFDEAFYILDGELTFQLGNQLTIARTGQLTFAPRGVPHTLANQSDRPARYLIILTPAGFEREFAPRRQRSRNRATRMGTATHPRNHLPRPKDRRATLTLAFVAN